MDLPYKPAFGAPQELESVRGGFNDSKRLAELRVTFYLAFFFSLFLFPWGSLLLSWPSCLTERESSTVSEGALGVGVGTGEGWACLEACS